MDSPDIIEFIDNEIADRILTDRQHFELELSGSKIVFPGDRIAELQQFIERKNMLGIAEYYPLELFPVVSRTEMAEWMERDEAQKIPVSIVSFTDGSVLDVNSHIKRISGLESWQTRRLGSNYPYHFPDEYARFANAILTAQGNTVTVEYAAKLASTLQPHQYCVEARAFRIHGYDEVFRYVRNLRDPILLA